jgi:hypothetical protein
MLVGPGAGSGPAIPEPLAIIGGSAEYCRCGPRVPGGLDRMIKRVEDEASRMGAVARALSATAEAAHDHPAGQAR